MELHRRANMVNSRIRDNNRDMIYTALNKSVTSSSKQHDLKYLSVKD